MAASSVVKKLGIKPGQNILVLNAPEGYFASLGTLPEGTHITESKQVTGGAFDAVQLFAYTRADLDSLAKRAIQAVKPGGMFWIAYPKKSGKVKTDLSRDTLWADVEGKTGWQGVTLIAVDDTWSAMRFRPAEEVKSVRKP